MTNNGNDFEYLGKLTRDWIQCALDYGHPEDIPFILQQSQAASERLMASASIPVMLQQAEEASQLSFGTVAFMEPEDGEFGTLKSKWDEPPPTPSRIWDAEPPTYPKMDWHQFKSQFD